MNQVTMNPHKTILDAILQPISYEQHEVVALLRLYMVQVWDSIMSNEGMRTYPLDILEYPSLMMFTLLDCADYDFKPFSL